MLRKFLLVLFCVSFLAGCEPKEEKDPVAIKVNGIEIGVKEFNEAYSTSMFTTTDGPLSKEEFVETLIKRRLLLAEAEINGLDKEERFLKSVEFFWQQSLLKLVIDRQLRQLSVTVDITDQETEKYYNDHKEDFGDKTYQQKKERIRFMLAREKQQEALEKWMEDLRKNAKVKINKKRLGIK